ncbi:MAG: sugar transferase [Candidatus Omnitrophica bacterium]|nr:sugar transferase [Candidatus Omnitrophota bacterium]
MVKSYQFLKRLTDIAVSLLCIILLTPFFLAIAIIIRIDSKGPAVFRQIRIGQDGKPFLFFKFRTMRYDAEKLKEGMRHLSDMEGPIFKIKRDPRITRIGRFLRRTSIDEFPQLFNVLKGDMTLIGPRPPLVEEVRKYGKREMRRLSVKPGMTGLWQVSGRNDISFLEWMELDLYYIEHRSITLDINILIRTIPAVLSCKGAY